MPLDQTARTTITLNADSRAQWVSALDVLADFHKFVRLDVSGSPGTMRASIEREEEIVEVNVSASLPVSFNGKAQTLGVNPTYLSDALDGIGGGNVVIEINDELDPITIQGEKSIRVVMPARL